MQYSATFWSNVEEVSAVSRPEERFNLPLRNCWQSYALFQLYLLYKHINYLCTLHKNLFLNISVCCFIFVSRWGWGGRRRADPLDFIFRRGGGWIRFGIRGCDTVDSNINYDHVGLFKALKHRLNFPRNTWFRGNAWVCHFYMTTICNTWNWLLKIGIKQLNVRIDTL